MLRDDDKNDMDIWLLFSIRIIVFVCSTCVCVFILNKSIASYGNGYVYEKIIDTQLMRFDFTKEFVITLFHLGKKKTIYVDNFLLTITREL